MESENDSTLVDDFSKLPPEEALAVMRAWLGDALGFQTSPVTVNNIIHDGFILPMPRVGRAHHTNHRFSLDLPTLTLTAHLSLRRISTYVS